MKVVLVYRSDFLLPTERFIVDQTVHLDRYSPRFAALRRTGSPPAETFVEFEAQVGSFRLAPFRLTGTAPRLLDKIRHADPALIHAHFGPDGAEIMPLARRLGLPLVTTFHGYDATMNTAALLRGNWSQRLFALRRRRLAARGDAFVAVSNFVRGRLIAAGFPAERVRVGYVGVDTADFSPGPEDSVTNTVLFVGRFLPNKGAAVLIEAIAMLPPRGRPNLLLAGDGPERRSLERRAGELQIDAGFLGSQPRHAIIDLMRRSRIVCVPSHCVTSGASEGFGLAAVEAQACGAPVVVSDVGGLPEAVPDAARLVPPDDPAALADALARVLAPRNWREARDVARQFVVERFDLALCTEELQRIYDSAVDGSALSTKAV